MLAGVGTALTVAAVVRLKATSEQHTSLKADDRASAEATADPSQERRTSLERRRVDLRRQRWLNWSMLALDALVVIQLIVVGVTTANWGSFVIAVVIGGLVGGMRVYNLQRIGPRLRQLEAELSEQRPLPSTHP